MPPLRRPVRRARQRKGQCLGLPSLGGHWDLRLPRDYARDVKSPAVAPQTRTATIKTHLS